MAKSRFSLLGVAAVALFVAIATGSVSAQSPGAPAGPDSTAKPDNVPPGPRVGPGRRWGGFGPGMMGSGFMMGPGMMSGSGMWGRRLAGPCDPSAVGMAEWREERIERVVRPTEAQRAALADLRAASTKAAEGLAGACSGEMPRSSVARLAFMEKRMETMLQAIKTVRPAFEALYASLNDEQKARLDSVGPRGWAWHWSGR